MSLSRFLRVDDPSWMQVLDLCDHDIYHLPTYASLEAAWIQAEPVAFRFDNNKYTMLLPLLLRPTPSGMGFDAVTPYGYSSPVFTHGAPLEFMIEALFAFQKAAEGRGLITTFIRLHPIFLEDLGCVDTVPAGSWTQTVRGNTVTMPLNGDHDEWLGRVAKGHRFDICKLNGSGCMFILDSDEAWNAFPSIYRSTMERIGASKEYCFSDEYLAAFRQQLFRYVHCGAVVDPHGEVMCAALFTSVSGIVQYHLSGTKAEFIKQAPIKLVLSNMRKWAKENKMKHFHLGGGLGSGSDSLFEFKQRFGGEAMTFRTVSVVHNKQAFRRECENWCSHAQVESFESNGFFPPYRVPHGK